MSKHQHFIVGTAGHIDHGKTTLVRALTGVDLDSLPEERARGITIALGFTRLDLGPNHQVSFVDVPGHERLVRTMIAGASGLDAVMLCVSAVDGVMPQTREHLDILQILGVSQGIVALTMSDLVDAEMRELAEMDVEDAVAGTFLEGAPIIPTAVPGGGGPGGSAPGKGTQCLGLDALRAAIAALSPSRRIARGPFRLPIDRAFLRRGFGTVVTGTLRSGTVTDGDEVEVLPAGQRARVRGLQCHGQAVPASRAGWRTAINLAGVERDDLSRGQVVVHAGQIETASVIDARYRHLPSAPPIKDGARARLLAGTAEVMAVVSVLDTQQDSGDQRPSGLQPDREYLIQLRTETPIVLLAGDRFVLRRESPIETLGGGDVLDPWAPRARRRDATRVAAELRALCEGQRQIYLLRAGDAGLPPARAALLNIQPSDAGAVLLGDRLIHSDRVNTLAQHLKAGLSAWHKQRPLTPGAPRRDLRRGPLAHLDDRTFDALIAWAEEHDLVVTDGPLLRGKDFKLRPSPDQQATLDRMLENATAAGLEGSPAAPMLAANADAFMLLVTRGELVRVHDRALHAAVLDDLRAAVGRFFQTHDTLSTTDFKALSGQSRRMAIPLLEWLDAQRVTVRQGDIRRAHGHGTARKLEPAKG